MVLLLIKIEFKEDFLISELIGIKGLLGSIEDQDGYFTHSINIDLKKEEQLLLIVEWKNESAANNYLQTEEFSLLLKRIKKVGSKYSYKLAGVLSRGQIEIVKEQMTPPRHNSKCLTSEGISRTYL